jgi:hypothetical protein
MFKGTNRRGFWKNATKLIAELVIFAGFAIVGGTQVKAQTAPEASASVPKDSILLTIFLRHDESKTLDQINKELAERNWAHDFPPPGVEVETWYVMMGVGQVVTLRVPPDKLREVNRIIEREAWSAYRTEFYPTYDYKAVGMAAHEKALQGK